MKKDKLLERLLRRGTSTTRAIAPAIRAVGSTTSLFQPKAITRYSPFPPSTFITPLTPGPGSVVTEIQVIAITTENGEFLLTENNDNLIF